MKGLSILQPWASLIAAGQKRIETRGHRTHYRGDLLICASKGYSTWQARIAFRRPFREALDAAGLGPASVPLGRALAVARVFACRPTSSILPGELDDRERAFGDYSPGRFAWYFERVERLPEPIPVKGMLGLWDVPPEVVARVREQIGAVA